MQIDVFGKIASERRYESVVRQVLRLISTGEISPGAQLPPERDLAERLGVSRNVLREAFRVLEVRGIVHSRAGGGRYVRADNIAATLPADGVVLRIEEAVIADVLESRELLEVQTARLAATRATDDGRQAVLAACEGSDGEWAENVRFHTAVAAATGNFMLERLVRLQLDLLADVRQRDHYPAPGTATALLAEHQAIADAVARGDADAAEAAVRAHFAHTRAVTRQPDER
ncbi:FadR/GntR family transcriptional regulator [Actinocrispum wychmicini]|uniref:GntR family transcriptional repressor for pyruvate dehydrogenase complex n=1 Tax=Actinocrispum wychmicini TaxID=1213861 RepID=A0A4R2JZD6_9PSEU|nr:FCD domain-containing protein [Actinocrispum wychmicini]TCO62808.1 GntR family transcriptional repressor for pyruvate dehydrogenase complex [Actinocrispum wychmicini]